MTFSPPTYAVVTPARNESFNLGRLAMSLIAQRIPPLVWVVVDDGSTDGTLNGARKLAREQAWIKLVRGGSQRTEPLKAGRRSGRAVKAFLEGVAALSDVPDIVVKLDADISLDPDYFERLMAEFEADPSLGIASGTCLERDSGGWRPRRVTRSHVRGASRAYRWACFRDVQPLEERMGWDTVDEIRAELQGWKARSLPDLFFYHHRAMGERDGRWQESLAQGALAHYLGYRFSYVLVRTLYRMLRQPTAGAFFWGFAGAHVKREARCRDRRVRSYLREQQRLRRLPLRVAEALGLRA